jgi:hypothetical protein
LAEPTTTEPDEPPPLSGLEPLPDADALADVLPAAAADDELEELLLEHAVTAARPMTASAAIPLVAEIL